MLLYNYYRYHNDLYLGIIHRELLQKTYWNNKKVLACGRPQGLFNTPRSADVRI